MMSLIYALASTDKMSQGELKFFPILQYEAKKKAKHRNAALITTTRNGIKRRENAIFSAVRSKIYLRNHLLLVKRERPVAYVSQSKFVRSKIT